MFVHQHVSLELSSAPSSSLSSSPWMAMETELGLLQSHCTRLLELARKEISSERKDQTGVLRLRDAPEASCSEWGLLVESSSKLSEPRGCHMDVEGMDDDIPSWPLLLFETGDVTSATSASDGAKPTFDSHLEEGAQEECLADECILCNQAPPWNTDVKKDSDTICRNTTPSGIHMEKSPDMFCRKRSSSKETPSDVDVQRGSESTALQLETQPSSIGSSTSDGTEITVRQASLQPFACKLSADYAVAKFRNSFLSTTSGNRPRKVSTSDLVYKWWHRVENDIDNLIGILILLNAIFIFCELQYEGLKIGFNFNIENNDVGRHGLEPFFAWSEHVFNALYTAELVLRMSFMGRRYFRDRLNFF